MPPGQLGRYLVVGMWNTAFAYSVYAAMVAILTPRIHYGSQSNILISDLASLISSTLSITVAFLGYKWFVFKTRGRYLREWARCVLVYAGIIAVGLLVLPILVVLVTKVTGNMRTAPYLAGILMLGINVVLGFLGNRRISFRER